MEYNIEEMKADVRVALDENDVSTLLITDEDIDTLTLEQIIEGRILIAARIITQLAPLRMLDGGKDFFTYEDDENEQVDVINWYDTGKSVGGWVSLPADFHRIMGFKMSDWKKAAYSFITETDPLYEAQSSPFVGLRGNQTKPVVAITKNSSGTILEFWGSQHMTVQDVDVSATVELAKYLPLPVITSTTTGTAPNVVTTKKIDIPQLVYDPTVYYTAYLTALTLAQNDAAAHLLATSQQMIET